MKHSNLENLKNLLRTIIPSNYSGLTSNPDNIYYECLTEIEKLEKQNAVLKDVVDYYACGNNDNGINAIKVLNQVKEIVR